ncbi:unnamed protein product [Owenia fusiformis]|uniref:Uncharacterized protein n=1 Tax=Owenia fusiformis TaxID=6347 RepID=A0A8J1UQN8_OWEFU|nr:unnamed protein product [Owenia fusiformis]
MCWSRGMLSGTLLLLLVSGWVLTAPGVTIFQLNITDSEMSNLSGATLERDDQNVTMPSTYISDDTTNAGVNITTQGQNNVSFVTHMYNITENANASGNATTHAPIKKIPYYCLPPHSDADGDPFHLAHFRIACYIVGAVLAVIGILGNTLSFVVLYKDPAKGTSMFYLKALAIVDWLACATFIVFNFPFFLYNHTHLLDKSIDASHHIVLIQPISQYLFVIFTTLSSWVLVAISVDRYIAVCHPFKAPTLSTLGRARITLVVVSILSFAIHIPKFLEYETKDWGPFGGHPCTHEEFYTLALTNLRNDKAYMIGYRVFIYSICQPVAPVIILLVLNVLLVRALNKAAKMRASMSGDEATSAKADTNVSVTLISVAVIFLICMIPSFMNSIILVIKTFEKDMINFYVYVKISEFKVITRIGNSAVNFFIYCVARAGFRKHLVEMLCGKKQKDGSIMTSAATGATMMSKTRSTEMSKM